MWKVIGQTSQMDDGKSQNHVDDPLGSYLPMERQNLTFQLIGGRILVESIYHHKNIIIPTPSLENFPRSPWKFSPMA
jgi:hypothetical protein